MAFRVDSQVTIKIFNRIDILEDFYLITRDKKELNIAFHIPTNTIFRLPHNSYNIMERLKLGESIKKIALDINITEDQIKHFLNELFKIISKKPNVKIPLDKYNLDRITLHVSNTCNLKCRYCYAEYGTYNSSDSLMSEGKALQIIDFFLKNKINFKSIVFFGGEPLLNLKVIKKICHYLNDLFVDNAISYLPKFVIITNGTIISQDIIKLIKEYNISITISIDDPKEINDLNRIFKNNKGTYFKIRNFIKNIKERSDTSIRFEATYTNDHKRLGYSENDIYSFMKSEFGLIGKVVPELSINYVRAFQADYFKKRLDEIFINTDYSNIVFDSVIIKTLINMANGIIKELCPIGSRMIAISSDGEIYPCHMSVGKKNLSLGSVDNDNIFINPTKYYQLFPYLFLVTKQKDPCKSCWVKNLCGGCSHQAFFDKNKNDYLTKPSNTFCNFQKNFIENLLINIAKIQSDQQKWSLFFNRIRKIDDSIFECI